MIKSRFFKVGIDNSKSFESTYMSKMVNAICDCIEIDLQKKHKKEKFFVNKEQNIDVEGINLAVKLNKDDFENIFDKKYFREINYVSMDEAPDWIKRCIVGGITKEELDQQRKEEVCSLDMMQNQSIIYHPESILQTQILCLISTWIVHTIFTPKKKNEKPDHFTHIFIILLIEHICSYLAGVFRNYDIGKNGRIDINGVLRAPRESLLASLEIFFDCILFGYTIKLMLDQDIDDFHYNAYQTYWLIIDMIIMFCTQPYIVMCQKFQVKSEITKNIYSLYFLQVKKLEIKKLKKM